MPVEINDRFAWIIKPYQGMRLSLTTRGMRQTETHPLDPRFLREAAPEAEGKAGFAKDPATYQKSPLPKAQDPAPGPIAPAHEETPGLLPHTAQDPAAISQEARQLAELSRRDNEVRGHERAHQAAGGRYASAPNYTYRRGPDGRYYVVDGSVQVDTGEVPGDPQATADKARQIKQAALAVSNPSWQDLRVAAKASRMEAEAKAELRKEEKAEGAEEEGRLRLWV